MSWAGLHPIVGISHHLFTMILLTREYRDHELDEDDDATATDESGNIVFSEDDEVDDASNLRYPLCWIK